ncbi:hypothetical protein [Prochlorococcus sp. MIT 0801]|uniref:hypothetical protein n=1 Tax=Prochlorococcus sp. MIT 0801 TaxID=1501269 RepID=UPI0004F6E3B8|nr:hypothetical protein [Prochlorococcus sp. MIT 0801]AIQ97013.1 putative Josephin [Prochlorococcus sp. MIT 0801]
MTKSVNLYLASGVSEGVGFWVINFTEEDNIFNSHSSKLLECYRKELFGLDGAIEVKAAINTTLDILCLDSKYDQYKLDNYNTGYSSEIPINLIEDIFDLWAYNYSNKLLWKKYIGLLNLRKKLKKNNNYINIGLKGDIFEFATKLDGLLSFRPDDSIFRLENSNDLMW